MTSALYFEVSRTVFRDRQRQGCRCRAYREVFTACLDTLYCLPSTGAKFELRNLTLFRDGLTRRPLITTIRLGSAWQGTP